MSHPDKKTPFARFFSSVTGRLVSRYGSATRTTAALLIGATRAPRGDDPFALGESNPITWNEREVVALTEHEASTYQREYDRAVRDGALRERTEDDYLAWIAAERTRERKAIDASAAAAKKPKSAEQAEKGQG